MQLLCFSLKMCRYTQLLGKETFTCSVSNISLFFLLCELECVVLYLRYPRLRVAAPPFCLRSALCSRLQHRGLCQVPGEALRPRPDPLPTPPWGSLEFTGAVMGVKFPDNCAFSK